MIDDFVGIRAALSFGIEANASWDEEIAAQGVTVHQYDHTIDAPPVLNDRLVFNKTKITPEDEPGGRCIPSILSEIGESEAASVILKIDIEFDEWAVFDATPADELAKFSQIVCEFHCFSFVEDNGHFRRFLRVLAKLDELFATVHVHANNYGPMMLIGGVPFPQVLEVSFASRQRYQFAPSDELFPTPLDEPNRPDVPDYALGAFRF